MQVVDGRRIKPEGLGVSLVEFAAALIKTTIDQDTTTRAFDQMTRTRDTAIGAMKRQFHTHLVRIFRNSNGLLHAKSADCQRRGRLWPLASFGVAFRRRSARGRTLKILIWVLPKSLKGRKSEFDSQFDFGGGRGEIGDSAFQSE